MTGAARNTPRRIREAGDSALLLELEAVIDPTVNAKAVAIAETLRAEMLTGVRDVVSTYRSVAVLFDPLRANAGAIAEAMHRACDAVPLLEERSPIVVDVAYGGESGPDLDEVAAFARCSAREVIARHSRQIYRVFMLGFLPGFAYMGSVDSSIAAPRRATPRVRVPAGSVGIAGQQTGVYPLDSPGGWQIIGRTSANVFDASRTPPALFAPGDRVRFVPVAADDRGARLRGGPVGCGAGLYGPPADGDAHPYDRRSHRTVTVLRPGLFTTIQDEGRWGHQNAGVPVSGPMDAVAHRVANALVGNPRDAATLETTLLGPELRIEQDTVIAVSGADLGATVDEGAVPLDVPVACRRGSVIRFGQRRSGARAYIAFEGGISSAKILGSRATHVVSGLGGLDGRSLRAGDTLPLGETSAPRRPLRRLTWMRSMEQGARLRVLRGPHDDCFAADVFTALQRTRFRISPQSDRMGYRLSPERTIRFEATGTMISDVTVMGGLQVPPSGDPILLMADRQTTGGYPQIATVITADLATAGQLAPGDWVEFEACSRADALAALVAQERRLLAFD